MYALFNNDNNHVYSYYDEDIQAYIETTNFKYAKEVLTQDGTGGFTYKTAKIDNSSFDLDKYNEELDAPNDITKAEPLLKAVALVMADLTGKTQAEIKDLIRAKL
jgi:hypothetical protein